MTSTKQMTTLQLSENLYPIDEVFMTFTQCLIKRAPQQEMLYWLFEIVSSGHDILNGMACIYLQFYSIGNTGLDNYIMKKSRKYKNDNNIKHLVNLVNNLRLANPTIDSYEITSNYLLDISPNKIYKTQEWARCHPPYSQGLLKSIHANDRRNIGAYLNIMLSKYGFDKTYGLIIDYLIKSRGVNYETMTLTKENFPNDIFLLSAIIANVNVNYNVDRKAMRFIAVPQTAIDKMFHHFTKKSEKYYIKLSERRLYGTHQKLGPGDYGRFHIDEGLQNASWYSWEYYCYESTEWNKRFKKYGGVQNHETKRVDFPDDDCLEGFYDDDNAMDFDEQCKAVQDLSLHDIYVYTDINQWFSDLLSERLVENISNIKL